jgi:hypothetical protein
MRANVRPPDWPELPAPAPQGSVAKVFEDEKPQYNFDRRLTTAASPALQTTACLRLENTLDQLLVIEQSYRPCASTDPGDRPLLPKLPSITTAAGDECGRSDKSRAKSFGRGS